jgi:hypothetical protein
VFTSLPDPQSYDQSPHDSSLPASPHPAGGDGGGQLPPVRIATGAGDEPPRVGGRRPIPQSMIADVVDGLRRRGWLPEQGAAQ